MTTLAEYIADRYEDKEHFARSQGVHYQTVCRWCRDGYVVMPDANGIMRLFLPRRVLK